MNRCRQGDGLAWEALVRRFQSRVYAVSCHYMRDADEARDVAQDIFVRVYQRLDSYDGTSAFIAWLLRVSRNVCIDRLRRRSARPPAADVVLDAGVELAGDGPDPEVQAVRTARKALLYRALHSMSDKNREIILLKEIHGLKLEEISEMLDLPIGTVKSRSSRARVELATRVRALTPSYGV
ncbi:MAG: sigma-70 family RNA polymerase sigma factor [Deltaproteobacteria bacterium]|nr:sigma-70 family RNA polymerase sigma factor [Deltaproteobacteria bacterium]